MKTTDINIRDPFILTCHHPNKTLLERPVFISVEEREATLFVK